MKKNNKQGAKRAKNKPSSSVKATGRQVSDSQAAAARMCGRSRVTNAAARGSVLWLDNLDHRGPVPRRFKDIVGEVTSDLGGPDQLSECTRQIIRRIASLSVWCESVECRMADGEDIDIDRFQRTSNSLRRLCESIGLERRQRTIVPHPLDYAREYDRRKAEEAVS
jgi:hypothetical protein